MKLWCPDKTVFGVLLLNVQLKIWLPQNPFLLLVNKVGLWYDVCVSCVSNVQPHFQQEEGFEDIMILPYDKGHAVVVADKDDYDNQIWMLLNDSNTYRTPTPSLECKMNYSTVWCLHGKGELPRPSYMYDTLRSTGGLTQCFLRSTSLVYPYGQLFPSSTPPLIICTNSSFVALRRLLDICCYEFRRPCPVCIFWEYWCPSMLCLFSLGFLQI